MDEVKTDEVKMDEVKMDEVKMTDMAEQVSQAEEAPSLPEETMEDYKAELEASYRKIRPGDIVTGTVIDVTETDVTIDLNYYAPGRIPVPQMSNDPHFAVLEQVFPGDSITATVVKTDDGAGNLLLSCKEAADVLAWDKLKQMQQEKRVIHGKVGGIVNGGVVMYAEGVRGFIPASKLSLQYVENLETYLNQSLDVLVFEVDAESKRLILSAKELLQEKAIAEKNVRIQKIAAGTVVEGVVEQLKEYGAFVDIGDGISGLLHISQISDRRLKHPKQVLAVGDKVKVKITKIADGKISLSIREANEVTNKEMAGDEVTEYTEEGQAATGLASLLAGFKLK